MIFPADFSEDVGDGEDVVQDMVKLQQEKLGRKLAEDEVEALRRDLIPSYAKEPGKTPSPAEEPEKEPARTWFVRKGRRVHHLRGQDGKFHPKNQTLANFSSTGIVPSSKDRKPLEEFE